MTTPQEAGAAQRSVGELIGEVTGDLSKLLNQELELAKLEIRTEVRKAGKTAGGFAGAGGTGYFAVLFLSTAAAFALADLLGHHNSLGFLVVGAVYAAAAGVLFLQARATAKTINPKPEMTVQTLKEDAQWTKTRNS